jgi:hypothetical protein
MTAQSSVPWASQWATIQVSWYGPRPLDRQEYIDALRPVLGETFEAPQYPAMHYETISSYRFIFPDSEDAVGYWEPASGPFEGRVIEGTADDPERAPLATIVSSMKWNVHRRDGGFVTYSGLIPFTAAGRAAVNTVMAPRRAAIHALSPAQTIEWMRTHPPEGAFDSFSIRPYGETAVIALPFAAPPLPAAPGMPAPAREGVPWGVWAGLAALAAGAMSK